MKGHRREKHYFFHLMTSAAKVADFRSNLIEKRFWGMKRAIQCFLFLPSYHTFGVNRHCLQKNHYFLQI